MEMEYRARDSCFPPPADLCCIWKTSNSGEEKVWKVALHHPLRNDALLLVAPQSCAAAGSLQATGMPTPGQPPPVKPRSVDAGDADLPTGPEMEGPLEPGHPLSLRPRGRSVGEGTDNPSDREPTCAALPHSANGSNLLSQTFF